MWLCSILLVLQTYIFVLVACEGNKNSEAQENPYKDCDFQQSIQSVVTSYYIQSPNYPDKYQPNTNCRWYLKTVKNHKVVVHCNQVEMYESVNCTDDSITISTSADEHLSDAEKFCAPLNFAAVSDKNEMIVVFTSANTSKGGLFSCSAGAEHVPNDSKIHSSQKKFLYQRDVSAVSQDLNDLEQPPLPSNSEQSSLPDNRRYKKAAHASAVTTKITGGAHHNSDKWNTKENQTVTECDCGWTSNSRIVSGESTGRHEFPSVAALVITETGRVYCGGAVITNRHILTAAHCIAEQPPGSPAALANGHEIWKGKYSNGSRLFEFQQTYTHPNYNKKLVTNDLAIIEVKGYFSFGESVAPACLPLKYQGMTFIGDSVLAAGWGTLSYGGRQPSFLQKATLQVIPTANCSEVYGRQRIRDTQICAIGVNESDTCQGDSGGPLLWSDVRKNRFILAGIISYGIGCASGKPSVNSRISVPAYLRWIRKITKGYRFCVM
nr:PREDICTED: venom serine protease-like [Bemisia tabaci]